jgi:hypothetical protein
MYALLFRVKKPGFAYLAPLSRIAAGSPVRADHAVAWYERRKGICGKRISNRPRCIRLSDCARNLRIGAYLPAWDFRAFEKDRPLERRELAELFLLFFGKFHFSTLR